MRRGLSRFFFLREGEREKDQQIITHVFQKAHQRHFESDYIYMC